MTEAEWLACEDPEELFKALFEVIPSPASRRKLLLFCVHCCFFDSHETNPNTATCQYADHWRLAERHADDEVSESALREAWCGVDGQAESNWELRPEGWALDWVRRHDSSSNLEAPEVMQLLREIFGNPFGPVRAEPAWLTSDVLALAHGIYAERAFDRMADPCRPCTPRCRVRERRYPRPLP